MRQRRFPAPPAVLAVVLLLGMAKAALAQPMTELLPASTLVYVGWSSGADLQNTAAARMLADARINGPWSAYLQQQLLGKPAAPDATGAALRGIVGDVAHFDGCFALLSFTSRQQNFDSQAVLILNLGAGKANFERHFAPFQEQLKATIGDDLKMIKIANAWLWTWAVEKKATYTWGFLGDRFVAYFGSGAEKFLSGLAANQQDAPLGKAAKFTDAMNAVPGPALLTTYVDASAALDALRSVMANADNEDIVALTADWPKTLDIFGLGLVKSVVQKTTLADGQFVTHTLLHTSAAPQGLLALAAARPADEAMLKCIPRDAIVAASATIDAGKAYERLKTAAIALGGNDAHDAVTELEKSATDAGVPIADALTCLGDQWVLYDAPSNNAFFASGWVLVGQVKNADKFRDMSRALVKMTHDANAADPDEQKREDVRQYDAEGVTIHYFPTGQSFFNPAWALVGDKNDRVIVALYPQLVEDAVAQLKADSSILDNPAYAAVRQRIGGDGPGVFIDMPSLARNAYAFINAFDAMAGNELIGMEDMPAELLPPLRSLLRYLAPEGLCIHATDAGIELTQTSANPLLSPLSLAHVVPVALPLSLPSLAGAALASTRQHSANNLTALGQLLMAFADKNDGKFPADLNGIAADPDAHDLLNSPMGHPAKGPDIVYLPAHDLGPHSGGATPIAFDAAAMEKSDGTNILYADGHVAWSNREEAQRMLKAK